MTTVTAPQPDVPTAVAETPPRRKRVLMLTHRLPYPPDRGDRIRSWHLIKTLSQHVDLAVACVSEEAVWLQHHQLLSTMARRVAIYPISSTYTKIRAVQALATGKAVTPACHFRDGLAQQIMQWQETEPFDAVLTFCSGMIDYAKIVLGDKSGREPHHADPAKRALHVLDLVDVDSAKWRSYAKSTHPPMSWVYAAEARRLRRIEAAEFDYVDAITVISENERTCYREHVGAFENVHVVRNGVDLEYFEPLPDTNDHRIVFVGVLDYWPNAQAITWFVNHVMPLLRQRVSDVTFQIVGRNPTPPIEQLDEKPGVEVIGSVPDVREYLGDASVVVAPLQIARGTQNKVLEGMACGRAVVCSSGAAKGVDAVDGEHLLVADEPQQWVDHIASVIEDGELRKRIAAAARQRVESHYNWDAALGPMLDLLQIAVDR